MKTNIGKMNCETCGNVVTVKQNENGTLSYRCDECDAAPYAKQGTLQNETWRARLVGLKAEIPQGGQKKTNEQQNDEPAKGKRGDKKTDALVGDIWGFE